VTEKGRLVSTEEAAERLAKTERDLEELLLPYPRPGRLSVQAWREVAEAVEELRGEFD